MMGPVMETPSDAVQSADVIQVTAQCLQDYALATLRAIFAQAPVRPHKKCHRSTISR